MERATQRHTAVEARFQKDGTIRNALALIGSGWLLYRLTADRLYLQRAFETADTMAERCFSVPAFYLWRVFLRIEQDEPASAAALLAGLKPYRGFFKSHDQESHTAYLFLSALLAQRTGKKRAAEKHRNALAEADEPAENVRTDALLAFLHNERGDYETALGLLSYAYANGCRSAFLFLAALDCFLGAPAVIERFDAGLFFALTQWALQKEINIDGLVRRFRQVITAFFPEHAAAALAIYERYPSTVLLEGICRERIGRMDYSARAFRYYKEAEAKQLALPELYAALIKSAALNHDEGLNRYALERYLKSQTGDRDLLAFVYHMIVTKHRNSALFREYETEIRAFAAESLRNSQSGRYYNSLYAVYIESGADGDLCARADKFLYEDLFKFRLYAPDHEREESAVRFVWISEKEQRETKLYTMTGQSRVIIAADEGFGCHFLDGDKRVLAAAPHRAVRLVEGAGVGLYRRYFDRGLSSPELLIALAAHYMTYEEPPPESLPVLKQAEANAFLSDAFRMAAKAAIGHYYAARGDYETAARFYKETDENSLSDRYIEQMLLSCVNGADYDNAARLIIKKADAVSDRTLFYAVKRLIAVGGYDKDIANAAYDLTMKSWYDKALTAVVFRCYNGGLADWQALSKTLAALSVSEPALDEIILQNAVWMRVFDRGTQAVFRRMAAENPDHPLVADYATFTVYAIIVQGAKPEYETVELLEQRFLAAGDAMTAYALCHIYLGNDIVTFLSERILAEAVRHSARERLIFPVFKRMKDKNAAGAYIDSNQPFLYKGLPGRSVKLFYRPDGAPGFQAKPMRYVRFGLYCAAVPIFYGETLTYYFCDEMETGSVTTKQERVTNGEMTLSDKETHPFYAINNALIYEQLFKYETVEAILTERLKERPRVKGWIV